MPWLEDLKFPRGYQMGTHIIKLVTKAANGYRNWERFRNRRMLIFKKGIDFEIDKDNGSIKIVEKKELGQLNVARAQN